MNSKRKCNDCERKGPSTITGLCFQECWTKYGRPLWVPKGTRRIALNLVDDERNKQDLKWGEQNHSQQAWTGILGEEFGEYCQAVNETYLGNATKKHEGGYDNILKELTHVAAVAVGAMESLMRNREDDK